MTAALLAGPSHSALAGDCTPPAKATNTVVKVVDAETLLLDSGLEVRLIGALAPRIPLGLDVAPAGWPAESATREHLEQLTLGRPVALISHGSPRDRYGRLTAQIFTVSGGGATWVQRDLVAGGLARAYALPDSDVCLGELTEAEAAARRDGMGLWSNPAFRPRQAADTEGLLGLRSMFAIVEGRVVSVASKGKRAYLNFGEDWRRDFTIIVPPRLLRNEPSWASGLAGLAGRDVRVRGWIERRNGPAIEISDKAEIELDVGPAADDAGSGASGPNKTPSP